ncbi:IS630 transposase-related protein, partial [Rubrivirga sp.]
MAISTDLRRRAVDAYERGDDSIPTVAARFAVGEASLGRWLRRKRQTGSV